MHVVELRCTRCDRAYQPEPGRYTCDDCGQVGTLDVVYDYEPVARELTKQRLLANHDESMWRYLPLLPIESETPVSNLRVGGTPLIHAERLGRELGLRGVWAKDEGRQPTGSLKDRASAVALARAFEEGSAVVTTASTGNAAAALAGLAASTGQRAVIFVPVTAPEAKIAQLRAFGATVVLVDGTYDAAFDLCMDAVDRFGWYNRNTGVNPYVAEGKKTVALEIVEQLAWSAPDAIFVSVGDGSIIGGVHKGLRDALALGWIEHMPAIHGVQAAGSDYLVQAWEGDEDLADKPPISADTAADSISADLPRDRVKAMAAVVETGGSWIRVSDTEILEMIPIVSSHSGVFPEPAAAAAFAGVAAAASRGQISEHDSVVAISTGSGLKDIRGVMAGVALTGNDPIRVTPGTAALDDVERGMNR
jgi:threonine synthase